MPIANVKHAVANPITRKLAAVANPITRRHAAAAQNKPLIRWMIQHTTSKAANML